MDQPTTTQYETDVLIVGAGPAGLMAAIELARRGVAFRLIEQAHTPSPHSKAFVPHAKTLETLDLAGDGLADTFVQHGYTAPGFDFGSATARPIRAEMSGLDTRFPYLLVLPQAEIEHLMEEHLLTLGGTVERDTTLLSFAQRDESVRAQIQSADGQEEFLTVRYLLGCDGAHSAVRHTLGLPFEGRGYPWTAFLGDVKIDGELPRAGIFQIASSRGIAIIQPFQEDDYYRIVILDAASQHSTAKKDLSLAELQESVNAIVPTQPQLKEPRWLTRWGAQLRQVPTYRVGRVFLAGDAAHIHSPAGGQGLNTGLQDAFNLAWKLALVLQGQAPATLLDSYNTERHPIGERVLHLSNVVLRSVQVHTPLLRGLRDLMFRVLMPFPPVQRLISENLSGIGITYRAAERASGNLLLDLRQPLGPDARLAGDRIPDVELKQLPPVVTRERVASSFRLYELLRQPGYALFVIVSADRLRHEREVVIRLLHAVEEAAGTAVHVYLVMEQGSSAEARGIDVSLLVDFKQQFRHKVGTQHGSVLLVRPDGYLAFHRLGFDQNMIVSALRPWVKRPFSVTDEQDISMHR